MLQPELKQRRDKIRVLMAQQSVDAALITCNVNLIYTFGRVVSGYLYLPLHDVAHVFVKRPNDLEGEHIHPIRKPEQLPELIKDLGLPMPAPVRFALQALHRQKILMPSSCGSMVVSILRFICQSSASSSSA